jgi:hypothetical protein
MYLRFLPSTEAAEVKGRLDKYREDCGCSIGAIVMLSVTVLWMVRTFLDPPSWQQMLITGLCVVFVSALTGKLIGLALAKVRFYLTIRNLKSRLAADILIDRTNVGC